MQFRFISTHFDNNSNHILGRFVTNLYFHEGNSTRTRKAYYPILQIFKGITQFRIILPSILYLLFCINPDRPNPLNSIVDHFHSRSKMGISISMKLGAHVLSTPACALLLTGVSAPAQLLLEWLRRSRQKFRVRTV